MCMHTTPVRKRPGPAWDSHRQAHTVSQLYDLVLQPGHISALLTMFKNINDNDLAMIAFLVKEEERKISKENKDS